MNLIQKQQRHCQDSLCYLYLKQGIILFLGGGNSPDSKNILNLQKKIVRIIAEAKPTYAC